MEPIDDQPSFAQADLLPAIRRFRWMVVMTTVIAAASAYAVSSVQAPVYDAEARLLLEDPRDAGVFGDGARVTLDPQRYVRNQVEFINSAPVLARTAELFDVQLDIDEIDRRVEARAGADVDLVTIRAEDTSSKDAARLANTTARAYQELVTEEVERNAAAAVAELSESKAKLQATITSAEQQLEEDPDDSAAAAERDAAVSQLITIESRADQLAVDASLHGSGVNMFARAEPTTEPARPQPVRNALVAAVLGLLGAATYAWWRSGRLQAAEHAQDPGSVLGVRLLGEIPRFNAAGVQGPAPTVTAPHSSVAQAYQFIVAATDFVLDGQGPHSVMVTSCKPDDGKTVTALNLAIAASAIGRQVLLIDADKRRRGLTQVVGDGHVAGLADLVEDGMPVNSCVAPLEIGNENVVPFVPAGRDVDDPSSFFRTTRFRQSFQRLRELADLTIVDTPPLLAVADTSAIAGQVDGIIVVVERGTPRRMLEGLRHRLEFVGTPVLGYVFNRAELDHKGGSYAYAYGYEDPTPVQPRARREPRMRRRTTARTRRG